MKLIKLVFLGLFFASGSLYGNPVFGEQVFQLGGSFISVSSKQRAAIQSVWPQFFLNNPGCRIDGSMKIISEGHFNKGFLNGGDFYFVGEEAGFSLGLSPEQITVLKDAYGINILDTGDLNAAYEVKIKMFRPNYKITPSDIERMAEEYGMQIYGKDFKGIGENVTGNILYGMNGRGELFIEEIGDRGWVKLKQGSGEVNFDEIVGMRLFEVTGDIKDLDTTWQTGVSFENLRDGSIGEEMVVDNLSAPYSKLSQGASFYVMEPIGGGGGGGGSLLRAIIKAAFEGHFDSEEALQSGKIQQLAVSFSSPIQSDPLVALPVMQCDEPLSLKINVLQ